ncbi:hypothetical protein RRG08_067277 [Elysia crispata]|uniref:Uncharacterized protein n=1 Tax=Elysia crispata TaxID=231223 RepID=A0AAE1DCE2_9GAST|nr:hypothetical protein RRG08_067277 [Elysia crispata]
MGFSQDSAEHYNRVLYTACSGSLTRRRSQTNGACEKGKVKVDTRSCKHTPQFRPSDRPRRRRPSDRLPADDSMYEREQLSWPDGRSIAADKCEVNPTLATANGRGVLVNGD